ncbi:15953_t:CDS:2 [Acaulospora colombiana]|uniref:15953_t:CDS:1 n=1 Tax=Acaulospora colombiana TaxID=27376 RepID=A0ACA9M1M6_9GLOM|nr:15953_t:CDS:2 [Acaulospora colombiana]
MSSRKATKKTIVNVKTEDEEIEETKTKVSTDRLRSRLRNYAFAKDEEKGDEPVQVETFKVETEEVKVVKKRKRALSPSEPTTKDSTPTPKKPKVYKMELDTPHPTPPKWENTYRAIQEMRKGRPAAVDTMGCHLPLLDKRVDPKTKDEVTWAAIQKLQAAFRPDDAVDGEEYLTLEAVRAAPVEVIENCINKVGFWRRKAQYIKSASEILHKDFEGDIPRSIEGLCSLPGVGMKMAMLAMQNGWGDNAGIGVDVHVHRITNRLGWHKKETKTPEETRLNLESWLPKEYHGPINPLLVGFGQTICLPVRPKCEECLLAQKKFELDMEDGTTKEVQGPLCPSAFKGSAGTRKVKKESIKTEMTLIKMEDGDVVAEEESGEAAIKIEMES